MALPSNYRWILVGNLAIRNRKGAPHYAPDFEIGELFTAIKDRIARDDVRRPYQKGARLMWCADLEEDNDFYKIIIQTGDKNVAGVSFLDFETLETRDIEKEENEGGHYAAHIIVKKLPDNFGKHMVLIEKVPGIYLSSVKDHLTWICNNPLYEKDAIDDEGKSKNFRAIIEIDGYQSKTIREALNTGTLQDIEFIGNEENHCDGLDEEPIIDEVVHESRWEIKKRVNEEQAKNIFGRILGYIDEFKDRAKNPQVFVRIKASNGQIKRSEIVNDGEEILEQAFIQNELVTDFDLPLTQRYETFRADMLGKMIEVADGIGN